METRSVPQKFICFRWPLLQVLLLSHMNGTSRSNPIDLVYLQCIYVQVINCEDVESLSLLICFVCVIWASSSRPCSHVPCKGNVKLYYWSAHVRIHVAATVTNHLKELILSFGHQTNVFHPWLSILLKTSVKSIKNRLYLDSSIPDSGFINFSKSCHDWLAGVCSYPLFDIVNQELVRVVVLSYLHKISCHCVCHKINQDTKQLLKFHVGKSSKRCIILGFTPGIQYNAPMKKKIITNP